MYNIVIEVTVNCEIKTQLIKEEHHDLLDILSIAEVGPNPKTFQERRDMFIDL